MPTLHIYPDKCEWMVGNKTICTVQSHQMAKVVCQSRVSSQSRLGVVFFSIGKKIRKCLAEIICCEIRNWPLVSSRPFNICLLVLCLKSGPEQSRQIFLWYRQVNRRWWFPGRLSVYSRTFLLWNVVCRGVNLGDGLYNSILWVHWWVLCGYLNVPIIFVDFLSYCLHANMHVCVPMCQ